MRYRRFSILARDRHFKNPEIILCHWCRIPIPIIKVTDEVCSQGIRCPFTVDDIAVALYIKAKLLKALMGCQPVFLILKASVNLP
jgi:hypothetical protein